MAGTVAGHDGSMIAIFNNSRRESSSPRSWQISFSRGTARLIVNAPWLVDGVTVAPDGTAGRDDGGFIAIDTNIGSLFIPNEDRVA